MEAYTNSFENNNEDFNNLLYQKSFELTVEWGECWSKHINERIKKINPSMPDEEIGKLRKESENILNYSNNLFGKEKEGRISRPQLIDEIKRSYPRLSQRNIDKLIISQKNGRPGGRQVVSKGNIPNPLSAYYKRIFK